MRATMKSIAMRGRPLIGGALAIGLIAVVFLVILPSVANWRDVWSVVKGLSWPWMVALLVVAAANVVTFAPPWMAVMPGLSFRPALAVTLASTASTYLVPGGAFVGMGLSFAMLRGWGYAGRPVTLGLTVASIWNQLVVFGLPAIALALLTAEGGVNPLLGSLAWIGLLVAAVLLAGFIAALSSEAAARRFGDMLARLVSRLLRFARRGAVRWSGESFVRFRQDAHELLRARWHVITVATLVGHLSMWLVLLVSLRATGVSTDEVSLIEALAAWSVIRVLGAIPIVPGGFGVVELGLTAALVGFGAPNPEAVAATLIYRVFTIVPPLLLGALAGATWRRQHPGWQSDGPVPTASSP
jgi:uncharacterized protein (TIRG00374 family)